MEISTEKQLNEFMRIFRRFADVLDYKSILEGDWRKELLELVVKAVMACRRLVVTLDVKLDQTTNYFVIASSMNSHGGAILWKYSREGR